MNSTGDVSGSGSDDYVINITSLIGIVMGLLLNVWQSLMMKHITLESECCKTCFIELSENE